MNLQDKSRQMELESAEKVKAAIESTPPEYRQYILEMDRNVNLNPKGTAVWAKVHSAYMQVDGRVKMLVDEHGNEAKQFWISTKFKEINGVWYCKAKVISELYGRAEGSASVNFGGTGVDKTNPLENAETSAIGRALGFMGYGLFGYGIASAEEVEDAIKRQEDTKGSPIGLYPTPGKQTPKIPEGIGTSPKENPSTKEWAWIKDQLIGNGIDTDVFKEYLVSKRFPEKASAYTEENFKAIKFWFNDPELLKSEISRFKKSKETSITFDSKESAEMDSMLTTMQEHHEDLLGGEDLKREAQLIFNAEEVDDIPDPNLPLPPFTGEKFDLNEVPEGHALAICTIHDQKLVKMVSKKKGNKPYLGHFKDKIQGGGICFGES